MILKHGKTKVLLRIFLYALALLLPFYLLAHANLVWNADPVFYNDDLWFARMCLPTGLAVYWQEYGLYRILKIPLFALINRYVVGTAVPHPLLSLAVIACATLAFVKASVAVGLPLARGIALGGLLGCCPLLMETAGFWTGALNYALALLLLALHLRATAWAQNSPAVSRNWASSPECHVSRCSLTRSSSRLCSPRLSCTLKNLSADLRL